MATTHSENGSKSEVVAIHTIQVDHVTISSRRQFEDVRRNLEREVPQLDMVIVEALRSGNQERTNDYEQNGPKLSIFDVRDHGAFAADRWQ